MTGEQDPTAEDFDAMQVDELKRQLEVEGRAFDAQAGALTIALDALDVARAETAAERELVGMLLSGLRDLRGAISRRCDTEVGRDSHIFIDHINLLLADISAIRARSSEKPSGGDAPTAGGLNSRLPTLDVGTSPPSVSLPVEAVEKVRAFVEQARNDYDIAADGREIDNYDAHRRDEGTACLALLPPTGETP